MLGGGDFIYEMQARLRPYPSYPQTSAWWTRQHSQLRTNPAARWESDKRCFPVWVRLKEISGAKLENKSCRLHKILFQLFFSLSPLKRLMSKIHIIIAFESLTCLTFTVLSAEAPLHSLVNGFQTSSWLKHADVIERRILLWSWKLWSTYAEKRLCV